MTRFGVDWSYSPPSIDDLLAASATFCIRYLSTPDAAKNLTPPEAQRLTAAGLDLVVVYQRSKAFMLEGHDAGRRDAAAARLQADACGMPDGRPIYFALDIDPNPLTAMQWAQVEGYLDGAAEVLGQPAVGVYGGWLAIDRLVGGGLAAWGWQTASWSAGRWSPLADLQQYAHNVPLGGGLVDHDRATRDQFGQWKAVDMARAPFAEWHELPDNQTQPIMRATQVIMHSMAIPGAMPLDLIRQWSKPGTVLESHFIVGRDGKAYQLIDTGRSADANYHANRRPDGTGAISIETEDNVGPPDVLPWTPEQVAMLVRLALWAAEVHGIPTRQCRSPSDPGQGFHTLFGAPSEWTPVAKTCPGRVRIQQWHQIVLPAIQAGQIPEVDMPLDQSDKDWIAARLEESERRVARYVDHGDAAVAGSGNHHVRVREDVAAVRAILEAGPTPVPVTVDAAAVVAELVSSRVFLDAVATTVADELARRGAE